MAKAPSPIALAVTAALAVSSSGAAGHDWYTGLQNQKGESCCGGEDCAPLSDDDVTESKGGYTIKSLKITVPYSQAQSSRDSHFHACLWGTPRELKCFFAPVPAT